MPLDIIILQHADKVRLPGDHGLTELGKRQAAARGESLRNAGPVDEVWCSTLRRSRATADIVAAAIGFDLAEIRVDGRIAERINWWNDETQSREAFRDEWERSTSDRDYQPQFGNSSRVAGDRFAAFLIDLHARTPDGRVLVVSHGGVTVDLVRTWFGDERVRAMSPHAFENGIPACALTHISLDGNRKKLHQFGNDSLP